MDFGHWREGVRSNQPDVYRGMKTINHGIDNSKPNNFCDGPELCYQLKRGMSRMGLHELLADFLVWTDGGLVISNHFFHLITCLVHHHHLTETSASKNGLFLGYTPENQHGTWKWTPRRGDSYEKPSFLGSMLVFGGVPVFFLNETFHRF